MSGRAAAFRVARRNTWRNRRRTVFLVSLIGVPVAVSVVVAGMFRAGEFTPQESLRATYGDADIHIGVSPDAEVQAWLEDTLEDISPEGEWTQVRSLYADVIPDLSGPEVVSDVDPADPIAGSMRAVVAGRAPESADEVALSSRLAERLGVTPGDEITLIVSGGEQLVTVVGLIGSPRAYDEALITVVPALMDEVAVDAEEYTATVLVQDPQAEATAYELAERWSDSSQAFWPETAVVPKPPELSSLQDEFYVYFTPDEVSELLAVARREGADAAQQAAFELFDSVSRPQVQIPYLNVDLRSATFSGTPLESAPTIATGVSALLLLEVAFIAGAAFAAGTRRRLREIGLLGANGASDKHVRLTVIGEGLMAGVLGAAAGIAVGVAALVLGRPLIQPFVSKLLVGVGVMPWDVVGPAVVAVLAATLAAWVPARTASRVPTITALQGRMPSFPPRRWVVPVGFGLAGMGGLLIVVALASTARLAPAMVIVGGGMAIGGATLLAGPVLAFLSRAANIVSATPRLVLRDSGRHRTRAAVGVAATMVILLIPVLSLAFRSTYEAQRRVSGRSGAENHLVLVGVAPEDGFVGGARAFTQADVERLARLLPTEAVAQYQVLDTPVRLGTEIAISRGEVDGIPPEQGAATAGVAVATPELVAAIGSAAVGAALGSEGVAVLGVGAGRIDVELGGDVLDVPELAVPVVGHAIPDVLITEEVAARLPESDRHDRALFVLSRPLTDEEWETVHGGEFDVIGGWSEFTVADLYPIMLGGTLVLVLIIISLVTAVSAAEVDQDLGIVVAVGAAGSIRRRFLAVMAGYQTVVAAVLAIPLGLGLLKAVGFAQDSYYAGPFGIVPTSYVEVPWPALAAVGVALPVLVAVLTVVSVRSAAVTPPRRPT